MVPPLRPLLFLGKGIWWACWGVGGWGAERREARAEESSEKQEEECAAGLHENKKEKALDGCRCRSRATAWLLLGYSSSKRSLEIAEEKEGGPRAAGAAGGATCLLPQDSLPGIVPPDAQPVQVVLQALGCVRALEPSVHHERHRGLAPRRRRQPRPRERRLLQPTCHAGRACAVAVRGHGAIGDGGVRHTSGGRPPGCCCLRAGGLRRTGRRSRRWRRGRRGKGRGNGRRGSEAIEGLDWMVAVVAGSRAWDW